MTCSWLVNEFFMTYVGLAHGLQFITRVSTLAHDLFTTCLCIVLFYDSFATFSKFVHVLFLTCSQLGHNLLITCLKVVHEFFLTCSWLLLMFYSWLCHDILWLFHGLLFITSSWIVHDLVMICSWLVHELFMACSLPMTFNCLNVHGLLMAHI